MKLEFHHYRKFSDKQFVYIGTNIYQPIYIRFYSNTLSFTSLWMRHFVTYNFQTDQIINTV
jgi:hypothetical protein